MVHNKFITNIHYCLGPQTSIRTSNEVRAFIYLFIKNQLLDYSVLYCQFVFRGNHCLNGSNSSKQPANDATFPRWTAIEILSEMCAVSSFSIEDSLILRPNSDRKFAPSTLIGPCVSTATGMKKYLDISSRYLSAFWMAACSAAGTSFLRSFRWCVKLLVYRVMLRPK